MVITCDSITGETDMLISCIDTNQSLLFIIIFNIHKFRSNCYRLARVCYIMIKN